MSENEQMHTPEHDQAPETSAGMGAAGLVRGVAGRVIKAAGLVDLRGVPPEQVAQIESIEAAGAVLGDEGNREALGRIPIKAAGGVAIAKPGYRVVMAPNLELTKAMLEGMPADQKIMFAGIVTFHPEVPPTLVTEKLAAVDVLGILIACQGVHGALMGIAEVTGHLIALPDDVGAVVRNVGQNEVTRDYLERVQDNSAYINIGQTTIADDVPEELLDRKIISYHNVGQTVAPTPLLNLLKARCPTNLGQFANAE